MNATKDSLKTSEQLLKMVTSAKAGPAARILYSDMARPLLDHAVGATREYENTRTQLGGVMDYCRRQLERAQRELAEEGRVPNSLGVLQGNGVEVDRLCGELARTRKAAEAAQELLATLGIGGDGYIDLTAAENARHEAWAEDEPGPGERMPDGSHREGNCTM